MVSPLVMHTKKGPNFFWNIEANVGERSPNEVNDVLLVQLGYFAMSNTLNIPEKTRAIFRQVRIGNSCTGRADDPLVKAIKAHQVANGGVQDGHVSPIRGSSVNYAPTTTFMLCHLSLYIARTMPGDYPRIDRHPNCPAPLKAVVAEVFNL